MQKLKEKNLYLLLNIPEYSRILFLGMLEFTITAPNGSDGERLLIWPLYGHQPAVLIPTLAILLGGWRNEQVLKVLLEQKVG